MKAFRKWLALLLAVPMVANAGGIVSWRERASEVRALAENDCQKAFEDAKKLQESIPADAMPADRARMLNILARIELYLALTDWAGKHAEEARALAVKAGDKAGVVEADLNISLNAVNQGRIEAMREAVNESMENLAGVNRPELLAEAMLRSAMMYRRLGQIEKSVTIAMQAMDIAKGSENPLVRAYAEQGLAISYDQSARPEEARAHFERLLVAARQAHSRLLEADALLGLSQFPLAKKKFGEAEALAQKAIAIYRSVGAPFYVAHAVFQLSRLYSGEKKYVKTQKLLDEDLSIYEKRSNSIGLWWTLIERSSNLQALGRLEEARSDALRSSDLAEKIGFKIYQAGSAKRMAEVAAAMGDFRQAFEGSAKAAELGSAAENEKSAARMEELARNYQAESKQKQIDRLLLREEKRSQEVRWLWTMLGGSALLFAIGFLFARKLRHANMQLQAEIVERRIVEDRLALKSFALDQVREGAFLLDREGRLRYVNEEACRSLGYDREELLGMTVFDIDPNLDPDRWGGLVQAASEGRANTVESHHRTKDGRFFPIEVTGTYFEYEGKRLILALVRDITERKRSEELLHLREKSMREILENSPDAISRYDRECRRVYVNPKLQKQFGLPLDEILGKTPAEVSPVPDGELLMWFVREVLESGKPFEGEMHYRLPHGEDRVVDMRIVPEYDAEGRVATALAVGRDITAIKLAGEALAAKEREFRTLAENSPDNIVRYDAAGRRVYLNSVLTRLLGGEMSQLLGKTPETGGIVAETDKPEYAGRLRKVLESGEAQELELAFRLGNEVSIHNIRMVAERNEQGEIVGALAIGRDITERKLMEEQLREKEKRYRGIFDNLSDSLYLLEVTPDGRFRNLEVNPAFEKSSGIPSSDLVGKFIEETVSREISDTVIAKYRRCVDAGKPIDEEVSLDLPSGTRHYHSTLVPVRDESGRIYRIVGISRDITERKQMENELARREMEFRTLVENSPAIVVRYGTDLRRKYVNPAYEREIRLPLDKAVDELPDAHWQAVNMSFEGYKSCLQRVMESGIPDEIVVAWPRSDSGVFYYSVRIVAEYDTEGKSVGVLMIGHNVTALIETERRLEDSERKLREMASRQESAREEERKHFARELHDDLGQNLTAMRLCTSVLDIKFGKGNPVMAERLHEMLKLIDRTKQVVRNLSQKLRPAVLDMGMAAALEWLVEEFSHYSGVSCDLSVPDRFEIDDVSAIVIFRAVQESLTNIAKHANASKVAVKLEVRHGIYELRVIDDGAGFAQDMPKEGTFGLLGMQERLSMLGGELYISSVPGRGTEITVRMPVR